MKFCVGKRLSAQGDMVGRLRNLGIAAFYHDTVYSDNALFNICFASDLVRCAVQLKICQASCPVPALPDIHEISLSIIHYL